MRWTYSFVTVTVAVAALTGSSAAQPTIANNRSFIIGFRPTGVALSTGFGLIDTISMAQSTGVVTVTTRAAVAAQDLTVEVIVATPVNS
jgi:hypothetical protein